MHKPFGLAQRIFLGFAFQLLLFGGDDAVDRIHGKCSCE